MTIQTTTDNLDASHVSNPATANQAAAAPEGGKEGQGGTPTPPSPPSNTPSSKIEARGNEVYRPAPATNPVLRVLRERGLYVDGLDDDTHRITCPWQHEHKAGDPVTALYRSPSSDMPMGSFHCSGTHEKPHSVGAFVECLGIDRGQARHKDVIRLINGELHRIVGAAEQVLAKQTDFYRSNGVIVRLVTDPQDGHIAIEPVSEQSLTMYLSAACDWEKYDGRSEKWARRDVPANIVKALLNSTGTGALPVLNGLVHQPYLSGKDSRLISNPGFDKASGIYAAFDAAAFPIEAPTRENAVNALARLKNIIKEFEFAAASDAAATVSAMLTATIRGHLNVAPGFNITASSPGSGKSYLASVIAPFAGPGEARNISYPSSQEEATKVVLPLALEQPAAVCFDDMPTDWIPHGAMNRMLTSGRIAERKLGSNTLITAKSSSFIMGTGNNIRPLRDMARRVASIYLLPKVETAATREYRNNPAASVRRHRGLFVRDALTIITAWKAAGSPKADVPNIAGFEEWSSFCRHSLIWLGEPDPATSLIDQITHDPDREQLGDLLVAWADAFGSKATLVRQVLKHMDSDKRGDLYDAVMELPCVEKGFVNQSRFGKYLGRNKNRIVNGLQLVQAEHSERRAWAVVRVSQQTEVKPKPANDEAPIGIERVWLDDMLAQGKTPTGLSQPA
jgi:hypothetical protein